MRFGLQLHGSLPVESYARLATRAETLGFHDVTVHDVLMRRPVWPLLVDIARATSTVVVGPNVTHPYLQHPAVIAANAAHLDDISGGRLTLGLGRGAMYELIGRRRPPGFAGLEAAMGVLRALLGGGRDGVAGDEFSLAPDVGLMFGSPRTVPIHLGVYGERGVRLAGRVADGVRAAAQWDPDYATRIRDWLAEAAAAAGRDPVDVELVVENWTCIHPDRELARSHARRILAPFLPHLGAMLDHYRIPDVEVAAARAAARTGDAEALAVISDTTVDRFMAAGDENDLGGGIDRFRQAGFDSVSFSGVLGPDTAAALEMIGEQITRTRRTGANHD